jgi:hypothetical protein
MYGGQQRKRYENPRTGNLGRFSPTLLAHAIAAHTTATPKQWQEPNPRSTPNEVITDKNVILQLV